VIDKDTVNEKVVSFFCSSNDFNGISLTEICEGYCDSCLKDLPKADALSELPTDVLLEYANPCKGNSQTANELKIILETLVDDDKIVLVYDLNPHVKRFPDRPKDQQKKILNEKFTEMCAYPTRAEVATRIDVNSFVETPYLKRLWACEPNLEPVYFDLEVLENYANDPRYIFDWSDFTGSIHLSDDYYESLEMKPRDQTYLEHFGLGFRKSDGQRVVSVPLIYLSRLTPEHQQRWKTHEESEPCIMDPDYYTTSIIGDWAEKVPIYEAFLHEMEIINQMCSAAGLPNMFIKSFKNDRPKYFRIPFRNTKEAYHTSVEEMDKTLSQNLNKKFFEAVLRPDETYQTVKHKKTGVDVVQEYGTLAMLNHWIKTRFKFRDAADREKAAAELAALDKVRKIRQAPAHKIEKDEHGRSFSDMHDEILYEAYTSLRTIRLIFTNHPSIKKDVEVPDWLFEGKIRLFNWKGDSK